MTQSPYAEVPPLKLTKTTKKRSAYAEARGGSVKQNDTHLAPSTATPVSQPLWFLVVVTLVLVALCLGFPQFHYTVALMIAAILRYKDTPGDIFARVPSG